MSNEKIVLRNRITFKQDDQWVNSNVNYESKDNKIQIKTKALKTPNISSHTLVDLVGLNKYASVGKTLLTMFGLAERQPIPLYQTVKGQIVEEFATRYLDELYGGRYNIESFTLEQFKNFNQFQDQLPFSGALDKLIHGDIKLPVEIKSKEMREYENIAVKRNYPKDQIIQGANQAYMYGAEKFMMLYGFLRPEISELLKDLTRTYIIKKTEFDPAGNEIGEVEAEENLWSWGKDYAKAIKDLGLRYEDIIFHHEVMDYDPRIIKAYREKAQKIYDGFYMERKIDRSLFKKEELLDILSQIKNE
jgi:hypothetical protein